MRCADALSTEAYRALGRTRETVELLVGEAQRVVGSLPGRAVRPVSAGPSRTGSRSVYLADVYVHPELRGRGLGVELVRELVENGPYTDVKWILHTADAHGLSEQFGFGGPDAKVMERLP